MLGIYVVYEKKFENHQKVATYSLKLEVFKKVFMFIDKYMQVIGAREQKFRSFLLSLATFNTFCWKTLPIYHLSNNATPSDHEEWK